MQKISNVSSLRDVFRNFENKFLNNDVKKVELTKSPPKLTKQYDDILKLKQSFTKGVDSHFIRFYKNTRTGDSFGFSFPEDNNEEITISIHHNSEKFFKNVDLQTLRTGLKTMSKLKGFDRPTFDQLLKELLEQFNFIKQDVCLDNVMFKLSNIFDNFSESNKLLIEKIEESQKDYERQHSALSESQSIINQKVKEFRLKLEQKMNIEQIRSDSNNTDLQLELLKKELKDIIINNSVNSRKIYGISSGSYLNEMIEQLGKSSLKIKSLITNIIKGI